MTSSRQKSLLARLTDSPCVTIPRGRTETLQLLKLMREDFRYCRDFGEPMKNVWKLPYMTVQYCMDGRHIFITFAYGHVWLVFNDSNHVSHSGKGRWRDGLFCKHKNEVFYHKSGCVHQVR